MVTGYLYQVPMENVSDIQIPATTYYLRMSGTRNLAESPSLLIILC